MTALPQLFVPLHRIIPFSNVEGKGNRTSIFLQGCKLNCLYCHNPETIPRYSKLASQVSLQYLYEQIMQAIPFIRGVTFSGGEPTIHHRKLIPLFKALKKQALTCYIDTSGFFDYQQIEELINVTDKFLFDLKGEGQGLQTLCFDRKNQQGKVPLQIFNSHQYIKTNNLMRNLTNLSYLLKLDKIEEVRLVLLTDFFDSQSLITKVAQLLLPYPQVLLKIIRVHTKGTRDPEGLQSFVPSIEQVDQLACYAKQCGIHNIKTIY
ncbi:4Fe-4S cluster-binding domain-containing protein [Volucribacter amazonae]|uniref:Radical SAM protein n=1 Tax=Volucribacter amazonae TaxID=256731 RepID=A0A9X4P952_9PAST|nr:4Fe-4S cluster-binding domain-containing protein [Volucribacter amazonae]MDG6894798.1 radical SAM protein [Volucribacter amazonae]